MSDIEIGVEIVRGRQPDVAHGGMEDYEVVTYTVSILGQPGEWRALPGDRVIIPGVGSFRFRMPVSRRAAEG